MGKIHVFWEEKTQRYLHGKFVVGYFPCGYADTKWKILLLPHEIGTILFWLGKNESEINQRNKIFLLNISLFDV